MARYGGNVIVAVMTFAVFAVCWVFSRLILFPYRVLHCTSTLDIRIISMPFQVYMIGNFLLYVVQVMNIVWTWHIVKVTVKIFTSAKLQDVKDSRSHSEDESSCGEDNASQK